MIYNLLGKLVYGLGRIVEVTFTVLITIIETIVELVRGLAKGFLALIGMGGCLFLFLLMGPFGLFILFNPIVFLTILFFIVFPILGRKFVSYLKYARYMISQYLYDYGNYLIKGEKAKYGSFKGYGDFYRRMEEERKREEYRKRQEEQQRQWEERFKSWQGGPGGFYYWTHEGTGQEGYENFGNYGNYGNPYSDFKRKYEESCDLLGISCDSDKYQIKLAYRQKAKEYHPDLNKRADATSQFQKINDAYEFLNDNNIERYKNLA